jgi:hypothetical protein
MFGVRIGVCSLVVVSGSLLLGGEPAGQGLRWKFSKGQVFKYQLKHREVRTVSVDEQKFEMSTESTYDWQWTVREVDAESAAVLELKLTNLRVSSSSKDLDFLYDSADRKEGLNEYEKKLINLFDQIRYTGKYTLRLHPNGRVSEVSGFTKIIRENDDSNLADFHALHLFDEPVGLFLQLALGALPEPGGPVGKWEAKVDGSLGDLGQVSGKLVCSLDKKKKDSLATIRLTGEPAVVLDTKWFKQTLRGTLKTSALKGAIQFDPARSKVAKSEVEFRLAGTLKLTEKEVPMQVSYQHKLSLEALAEAAKK